MQKVITVSLNGNAYQFEEPGYEAIRDYMELAEAKLGGDPDTREIIRDLEQAISEKCPRFLGPGKTVVSVAEADEILREIGPVNRVPSNGSSAASQAPPSHATSKRPPKRLYQIREGAMISGVCNGIAAFLNIDPTIVRIPFVLAAVFQMAIVEDPPWVAVMIYVLLVFVIPYAETPEQVAAGKGHYESIPYRVHAMVEKVKGKFSRQSSVGSR